MKECVNIYLFDKFIPMFFHMRYRYTIHLIGELYSKRELGNQMFRIFFISTVYEANGEVQVLAIRIKWR